MTKLFATVTSLCILSMSTSSFANDDLLALNLKTKEIVRLKLWYDGIPQLAQQKQQNLAPSHKPLAEELSRVIDKFED